MVDDRPSCHRLLLQRCDFVHYEGSKSVGQHAFMDFDHITNAHWTADYDYNCYAYVRVPCSKLTPEFRKANPKESCSFIANGQKYSDNGFYVQ